MVTSPILLAWMDCCGQDDSFAQVTVLNSNLLNKYPSGGAYSGVLVKSSLIVWYVSGERLMFKTLDFWLLP